MFKRNSAPEAGFAPAGETAEQKTNPRKPFQQKGIRKNNLRIIPLGGLEEVGRT